MAVAFWDENRLLVQSPGSWRILTWPGGGEVATGSGIAVPAPGGDRIAVILGGGALEVDGRRVALPPSGPVREVAWDGHDDLLVVCAARQSARGGGWQGPFLLPVAPSGCSAEPFGAFPSDGESIWRVRLTGGEPQAIVQGDGLDSIRGIVALGSRGFSYTRYHYGYGVPPQRRVLVVSRSGGAPVDLMPGQRGALGSAVPSPDGGRIAMLHSEMEPEYPHWFRLLVLDGDTATHPLPAEMRLTMHRPVWSPDGTALAVCAFQGIRIGIVVVRADGAWSWLGPVDGACYSIALACGGDEAVAEWESPDRPRTLLCFSAGGRHHFDGPAVPSDAGVVARPNLRLVRWTNAGVELEGMLMLPPASLRGHGPWPLVVDVHGGPVNGMSAGQQPNLERWCQHGFAAFAPDYRSSGIAGSEAMLAAFRAEEPVPGATEIGDILSGVDALVDEGIVDRGALFLFGHSWGANLVNRIVAADGRFRAAAAHEGSADTRLQFLLAWGGGGIPAYRRYFGGNPWQAPAKYAATSPMANVNRVRTPLLLLHGDHRTAEAIAWHTALREHGVTSELIFYREEGHVLRRPENREDLVLRTVEWFRRHAQQALRSGEAAVR